MVSPPGGMADGRHGPQTSAGQGVGVPRHWSGAGNGGTGGDRGIYRLSPEHGCTIHCDPSYHGLVIGGRAESGNTPIQAIVRTARPGCHGDQVRAGSCVGGEGDGGVRVGGRRRVG